MEKTPSAQLEAVEAVKAEKSGAKSIKGKITAAVAALALGVGSSITAIAEEKKGGRVVEVEETTMDIPAEFCEGEQASMLTLGAELVGQDGNKYYFPPEKCKTGYLSVETVSAVAPDPEKGYPPEVGLECDFTAHRVQKSLSAVCGPKGEKTKPFIGIAPLACKLGTGAVISGEKSKELPVVIACRGEGGHGYRGEFSSEESKEGRPHELRIPLRKVDLSSANQDEFVRRDIEVVLKHTLPEAQKSAKEKEEKALPTTGKKVKESR